MFSDHDRDGEGDRDLYAAWQRRDRDRDRDREPDWVALVECTDAQYESVYMRTHRSDVDVGGDLHAYFLDVLRLSIHRVARRAGAGGGAGADVLDGVAWFMSMPPTAMPLSRLRDVMDRVGWPAHAAASLAAYGNHRSSRAGPVPESTIKTARAGSGSGSSSGPGPGSDPEESESESASETESESESDSEREPDIKMQRADAGAGADAESELDADVDQHRMLEWMRQNAPAGQNRASLLWALGNPKDWFRKPHALVHAGFELDLDLESVRCLLQHIRDSNNYCAMHRVLLMRLVARAQADAENGIGKVLSVFAAALLANASANKSAMDPPIPLDPLRTATNSLFRMLPRVSVREAAFVLSVFRDERPEAVPYEVEYLVENLARSVKRGLRADKKMPERQERAWTGWEGALLALDARELERLHDMRPSAIFELAKAMHAGAGAGGDAGVDAGVDADAIVSALVLFLSEIEWAGAFRERMLDSWKAGWSAPKECVWRFLRCSQVGGGGDGALRELCHKLLRLVCATSQHQRQSVLPYTNVVQLMGEFHPDWMWYGERELRAVLSALHFHHCDASYRESAENVLRYYRCVDVGALSETIRDALSLTLSTNAGVGADAGAVPGLVDVLRHLPAETNLWFDLPETATDQVFWMIDHCDLGSAALRRVLWNKIRWAPDETETDGDGDGDGNAAQRPECHSRIRKLQPIHHLVARAWHNQSLAERLALEEVVFPPESLVLESELGL